MHTYDCSRCGNQFGSPAAVRMHLRKLHFNRITCQCRGVEIQDKDLKKHVVEEHSKINNPIIYAPPLSNKKIMINTEDKLKDEKTFIWEIPATRHEKFIVRGTLLKCRLCGKMLGDIHGREQHERNHHSFTEHIKTSLALKHQSWNILDHLNPSDVLAYISTDLKTKYCDSQECNEEINILVDVFIAELPYCVSHIIRGGSFGKQTCLRGHSDLDMVLFIENFPLFGGSLASKTRMDFCLKKIKEILQNSLLAERILITAITSYSLRFQYQCFRNDHIHHVDLLPCNDILGPAPNLSKNKIVIKYRRILTDPFIIQKSSS